MDQRCPFLDKRNEKDRRVDFYNYDRCTRMKCIVCSHHSWTYLFPSKDRLYEIPGNFTVVACDFCGLWMIHPSISSKDVKKYYPKHYYSYRINTRQGVFWRLRAYLILHSVRPNILSRILSALFTVPAMPKKVRHGKILDIGCGTGDTLYLLHKIGWKSYGLDIDKKAITIANRRGLKDVIFGTYKDIRKYPNNYFDAIRLYHVIEHLDDLNLCLSLIYKKLKNNGRLIIGTPNANSLMAKLGKTYWYNLDSPRHLFLFSPYTLSMILQKNLFKIKNITFSSGGGIVGSVQYWLREKFGMKNDLINNQFLVAIIYPLERILDWCKLGDVFVICSTK